MVYGFDADHLGRHVMVMGMDVLDQLQLGLRRPHHQNFFSAGQGRGDTVVVIGLFWGAPAAGFARQGMQFLVGLLRVDDGLFDIVTADVHDMGFRVVDPDDRVVMRQIKLPVGVVRAAVRAARAIMRQPRGNSWLHRAWQRHLAG